MKIPGFVIACALPLAAASNDAFLIRNVTVHPVTSAEVANVSLMVEDGHIAEIGAKIAAPKGIRIVDGKGLHVYPGMIDSGTTLGLSEVGAVRETVDTGELGEFDPQLRAEIAVNPASEHFPVVRANGITSVITMPGGAGRGGRGGGGGQIIAGQAALIHLDGWTWEEMNIRRDAAMQMDFPTIQTIPARFAAFLPPGAGPTSYTAARRTYEERLRKLNDFFEDARRYQKAKAAKEPDFHPDLKFEAMLPVLDRKVPMMVMAVRERAILDAIQFADKQNIRVVIAGIRELGKAGPELKAKNIPVVLGPTLALPENEDSPYDEAYAFPGEVYKAGVKFAFASFNNEFVRNLPYQAAMAVAFGLPYEEALKAITINPAEIWGVGDQYGSIEKGKWADLMITDGDPLEAKTQVKQLYIKGQQVDLSNKHTRLYEKYLNRP